MKVVSIHQPCYIPWLGLFYKIANCDCFVFLDDAQFSKGNVQDCNKIKTASGESRLKIPLDYHFGDAINEVRTKDELGWKNRHLELIEKSYKDAPYFSQFFPTFKDVLSREYKTLAELNIAIIREICRLCEIDKEFYLSSELRAGGKKEERVINICKELGADVYLSGNGASVYQDEAHFLQNGIRLVYGMYEPITYPQLHGEFAKNMSAIDYIFNCGFSFDFGRKG